MTAHGDELMNISKRSHAAPLTFNVVSCLDILISKVYEQIPFLHLKLMCTLYRKRKMLFLHVPFCYLNQCKLEPSKNNNEKLKLELKRLIKRETYIISLLFWGVGGVVERSHWSKHIWQVRLVFHYKGENKWLHQKANAHETVWFLVVILDRAINNNVACFVKFPDDCFTTGTINVHEHNFWIALACGWLLWEQHFSG